MLTSARQVYTFAGVGVISGRATAVIAQRLSFSALTFLAVRCVLVSSDHVASFAPSGKSTCWLSLRCAFEPSHRDEFIFCSMFVGVSRPICPSVLHLCCQYARTVPPLPHQLPRFPLWSLCYVVSLGTSSLVWDAKGWRADQRVESQPRALRQWDPRQ
jgi:hypothetical protein